LYSDTFRIVLRLPSRVHKLEDFRRLSRSEAHPTRRAGGVPAALIPAFTDVRLYDARNPRYPRIFLLFLHAFIFVFGFVFIFVCVVFVAFLSLARAALPL
jgi:hypothetical protein